MLSLETRQMNTMLIGTGLFMLIPMALFATRMYRNRAKEKAAVAALQEAEYVNILCNQGVIILELVPNCDTGTLVFVDI